MYSFFKVQPRSKVDGSTIHAASGVSDVRDTQLGQFSNSNANNFIGNGLHNDLHMQRAALDDGPEESEAYDPSGDRRKRRKVSVEPEDLGFESKQWNLVPPPRIESASRYNQAEKKPSEAHVTETVTPKKKRGRPPKAAQSKGDDQEMIGVTASHNTAGLIEVQNGSVGSPKRGGSARKKSMRLNTKGTLLSSPTSSQEPRPVRKASSPKVLVKKNPGNLTLKNGKFIPTLNVRLAYRDNNIGKRIDEILAVEPVVNVTTTKLSTVKVDESSGKTTHPFFLGKIKAQPQDTAVVESDTKAQESHDDESKKAVPWKDIVFKTKKPSFSKALQKPAWPPHQYHHIGRAASTERNYEIRSLKQHKQKAKQIASEIVQSENVLAHYTKALLLEANHMATCAPCERLVCTAREIVDKLELNQDIVSYSMPVRLAREKALTVLSPFDRGHAPGPLPWSQKYGPSSWEEVLQPECQHLYDWLKGLAVHHVQSGTEKANSRPLAKRKKRPKRREDELSDFIVDDDDGQEPSKVKNAILIVGPNGCGKTASVFAVAKQLGFEVFEIHSGMRRSQKDIFDKVGDMAKNHLVQSGNSLSRDSSMLPDTEVSHESDPAQQSISTLFGKPIAKHVKASRATTPQPAKEQKQSLILFEEVDHIFEEDRGFWSGVHALIEGSKRPVVMTCNTLQGIPLDELELFAILEYSNPPINVVGDYLTYIAAAEGHMIQPDVIRTLYATKHEDLRATMMELDLWCQMTIGSLKGGLDWFPTFDSKILHGKEKLRVFSKDTFTKGLDILPVSHTDLADNFSFLDYDSQVSVLEFLDYGSTAHASSPAVTLSQMVGISTSCSDADILSQPVQAFMAAKLWRTDKSELSDLRGFAQKHCAAARYHDSLIADARFDVLQPLNIEKPVFPPSQGRLAPTLDESRRVIATDLAPYVRSIAAYDLGLEAYRDEVSSSQGRKVRTTRAARAAAEGGDKSSTRPERWLPADLDLRGILETGGNWPRWPIDVTDSRTESIHTSPIGEETMMDEPVPNCVYQPELLVVAQS